MSTVMTERGGLILALFRVLICVWLPCTRTQCVRDENKRPILSSPGPLYQNEVKCSAFDVEMIFRSHANETPFVKESLCTWPHFKKRENFLELGLAYHNFCKPRF